MAARNLFTKIWEDHVVSDLGGGLELLHVDRHLLHDLGGPAALGALRRRGLSVRSPALTAAVPDHCISTQPGRDESAGPAAARALPALRAGCETAGIRLFDLGTPEQGIVHVVGPELGLTLPGLTVLCGDSHTCTHGGIGALAWGIGTSEVTHVLATQSIIQRRPATMRITVEGALGPGVVAKDIILHLISQLGAGAGSDHAIEFAGKVVREMPVEGRMTLCNLSIEMGAKVGMVAPDEKTFAYLRKRPFAPRGRKWGEALARWRTLHTDADAAFDREVEAEAAPIAPQITWGTSPEHSIPVDGQIPSAPVGLSAAARASWQAALAYQELEPGQRLVGLPVQNVFVGSCTNGRLSDLETAAVIVRGRQVAPGVRAWVVPGSAAVKRQAEALGLDRDFIDAGFEWREPGCSLCSATNGETVPPGERCVATSNRNFVGRQGPASRTHLASPATAAAAAVTGTITDVRKLGD